MLMDLDLSLIEFKRALAQHQLVVGVIRAGAPAVQSVIEDRSGQDDLPGTAVGGEYSYIWITPQLPGRWPALPRPVLRSRRDPLPR